MPQPSFREKCFQEHGGGEFRQYLRSDAAREENSSGGFKLQSQVPSFGAENRNENFQRLFAHGTLPGKRSMRNCRRRVRLHHFGGQPVRRLAFPGVAEEIEDIHKPGAGENAFVADVTVTSAQILVEFDLEITLRSEITMAALGSKNVIAPAIPVKAAFTEAGTGGDDRLISHNVAADGNDIVQRDQIAG